MVYQNLLMFQLAPVILTTRNFRCWPFTTGHILTAGRRFWGAAEVGILKPTAGGDAVDPEQTSRGADNGGEFVV